MYFKPKVSLKNELVLYAKVARELASRLPPGSERDNLIRRARWADSKYREDWGNAVGSYSPSGPEENYAEPFSKWC
jgi:hypothetical protein